MRCGEYFSHVGHLIQLGLLNLLERARKDPQNVKISLEIANEEIIKKLREAPDPNCKLTAAVLENALFVFDAISNPNSNISLLDRIRKLSRVMFFHRGWKASLDRDLEPTKAHWDQMCTSNVFHCVEILCTSLVGIVRYAHLKRLVVKPWELSSQRCESVFRYIRSFTSKFTDGSSVNVLTFQQRLRSLLLTGRILFEYGSHRARARTIHPTEVTDVDRSALNAEDCTKDAILAALSRGRQEAEDLLKSLGVANVSTADFKDLEKDLDLHENALADEDDDIDAADVPNVNPDEVAEQKAEENGAGEEVANSEEAEKGFFHLVTDDMGNMHNIDRVLATVNQQISKSSRDRTTRCYGTVKVLEVLACFRFLVFLLVPRWVVISLCSQIIF